MTTPEPKEREELVEIGRVFFESFVESCKQLNPNAASLTWDKLQDWQREAYNGAAAVVTNKAIERIQNDGGAPMFNIDGMLTPNGDTGVQFSIGGIRIAQFTAGEALDIAVGLIEIASSTIAEGQLFHFYVHGGLWKDIPEEERMKRAGSLISAWRKHIRKMNEGVAAAIAAEEAREDA